MLESPRTRAGTIACLLVGLLALGVWFGSLGPAPAAGAHPGVDALGDDYDRHVGQRVVVPGRVVETDPLVVAAGDGDGGTVRYRLRGVDRPVERGDTVWAFGVAEPGRTVRVVRHVHVRPAGYAYAKGVSLLAGLWVLVRLVRDWRVDRPAVGLVPAEGGDTEDDGRTAAPEGGGDA